MQKKDEAVEVVVKPERATAVAEQLTNESAIRAHLEGRPVERITLFIAVRYFIDGNGSSIQKPCSEEEWESVLGAVGLSNNGKSVI